MLRSFDEPAAATPPNEGLEGAQARTFDGDAFAALMDRTAARLNAGGAPADLDDFIAALDAAAAAMDRAQFRRDVAAPCRAHALHRICLEDPFTRRAFEKPRGFAGDAALMDYVYGVSGPGCCDSARGAALFAHMMKFDHCESVRFRRAWMAGRIDAACAARPGRARIASIGCGHFREAGFSLAMAEGACAAAIAFDQDRRALETARRRYGAVGVTPRAGSVRAVLAGRAGLSDLDLVYAAGLLEELADPVAERLIARLFDALRPGGRLVVSNTLPSVGARGYWEAVMDWRLTYRTVAELEALAADLPSDAERSRFVDPLGCVGYLTIQKRADA